MKKTLLIGLMTALVGAATSYGQGTVTFSNFSSNRVSRSDTGGLVANSPANGWKVSLYWLPDSAQPPVYSEFPSAAVATTSIGVPVAGQFSGGTVTISNIPIGGIIWAQVRGWEAIYNGQTYPTFDSVLTASGGARPPLVGTSNIFRIDTGDPTTVPPGTPGNLAGMLPFTLVPVPEPSVIGLGLLGVGTLLLLRRRK